ncbi:UPF0160 protein MYG1, mitochondrial-like isoform X2 [Temnothorax curvispinosus]|uniref:UPF0160 protein MYG1, mitochondrial-like isoform X2 n=1 Tax=Temnothorax curvispinosus TaxID=300111 RepID=A0A6J1PX68_9HYME|nr:UPF0160 protein MYG1, mitochondrial-like isoform X2 [Temnothorax curvispinosus]
MLIGTCDGFFNCPEVLACVLLKLLPDYKNASILSEFQESMSTVINKPGYDWTEKLSSAGLIYCHFGHDILKSIIPDVTEDKVIDEIFKIIYEMLIKEIDAVDRDLQTWQSNTSLSGRVSRLNFPLDIQEKVNPGKFIKVIALVREEFLKTVQDVKNVWLSERRTMRYAMENRLFEVDTSGEIIEFTPRLWYKEFLFCLEKEMNVSPSIKYIIWQEATDIYYIKCVPEASKSSEYRMLLPEAWGGLFNNALVEACGIEGARSVSPNRSEGVHKTKKGAMFMARKALYIGKTKRKPNTKDR